MAYWAMAESANKREALLQYLAPGETANYTPAAFFLHFGEGYGTGAAAIRKHQEFFFFTGMDFVKIQLELPFPQVDISGAGDYRNIPNPPLEFYSPQLEVVRGLVDSLKSDALVVLTLYSPFMIAGEMVGAHQLIRDLEASPDEVAKALKTISDSLLAFVRECVRIGVDGFYHSTQGGESRRFKDPATFIELVKPVDLRVMREIDDSCRFNILHVCDFHEEYGGYSDLSPFLDYPGHVVNVSTHIRGATLAPAELARIFGRPYMGGLDRHGPLSSGTEAEARSAARKALVDAPSKFILGADCTVPGNTPWANLKAAIDEAHQG